VYRICPKFAQKVAQESGTKYLLFGYKHHIPAKTNTNYRRVSQIDMIGYHQQGAVVGDVLPAPDPPASQEEQ
jgi:hypothetical protein